MKILVTTALPYANGDIHMGHLLEYLQADFWVRYLKMKEENEVLFICADDTHGTPIMLSAKKENISPQELIKKNQEKHIQDFNDFDIRFDHYSSTHSEINRKFCHLFYKKMKENNCIELKEVSQAYSVKDKIFLPDRFVRGTCPKCGAKDQYGDSCSECGATYSPLDMKEARSIISGDKPIEKKSKHVFFRLKLFHDFLRKWAKERTSPQVFNKLKEWLEGELKDWNISRDAPYFGFEIPDMDHKYFYVWLDAPLGYISSTEEWCLKNKKNYEDFWCSKESEIIHFIGKDIIYFHTLFWPAMLKNADFNTPTKIFVHGFLTINGEKMSKSKGTFINARTYLNHLSPDYLRFYFACKISSSMEDIDLNFDDFMYKVNSDLIGKIINLGSRVCKMLNKYFDGLLGVVDKEGLKIIQNALKGKEKIFTLYQEREFTKVMKFIRDLADEGNRFLDEKSPWKYIKTDPIKAKPILTSGLNIFRVICILLKPILPSIGEKVEKLFNEKPYTWKSLDHLLEDHKIENYEHLLAKMEVDNIQSILNESK